ncbi:hypothetical protein ANANG_G00004480, partial [Anguilla anguilla]
SLCLSCSHSLSLFLFLFLCLCFSALLSLFLFSVSHCSGLPGPGMELKDSSRPTEGEVYMNCKTAGEAYTDLNHYDMSEENTYDCLS